jgi:hypothetical protein
MDTIKGCSDLLEQLKKTRHFQLYRKASISDGRQASEWALNESTYAEQQTKY